MADPDVITDSLRRRFFAKFTPRGRLLGVDGGHENPRLWNHRLRHWHWQVGSGRGAPPFVADIQRPNPGWPLGAPQLSRRRQHVMRESGPSLAWNTCRQRGRQGQEAATPARGHTRQSETFRRRCLGDTSEPDASNGVDGEVRHVTGGHKSHRVPRYVAAPAIEGSPLRPPPQPLRSGEPVARWAAGTPWRIWSSSQKTIANCKPNLYRLRYDLFTPTDPPRNPPPG